VVVDGSPPDAVDTPDGLGVLWLPSMAVGAGVGRIAPARLEGVAAGAGDPDRTAAEAAAVAAEEVAAVAAAGVAGAVGVAVVPASVARGRSAIDPADDAAITPTPSASSPAIATIGTRANDLPTGRRSRQFGQNPETGVVTWPQLRQRTGRRRPRAMAWLAAFSVRDRF